MFLVATQQIQDPRFQRSVVLLLSVETAGAVGLIINKPSGMKLSGLFRDMRKPDERQDRIYYGGPVETRKAFVLLRGAARPRGTLSILREVAVSTSDEVIEQALRKKRAGKDYRLFLGYAGWGAGQLDQEILRGGWRVVPADAETVFHENETKVWRDLLRKGEEIIVRMRDAFRAMLLSSVRSRPSLICPGMGPEGNGDSDVLMLAPGAAS